MQTIRGRHMYRYFIQPIINKFSDSLIGYEMLIREFINQKWQSPVNFADIPQQVQLNLLTIAAQKLSRKVGFVDFNLTWDQFLDQEFAKILTATQAKISPVTLILEIIEEPTKHQYSTEQIIHQMDYFKQNGILIALDDVDTGSNIYQNIRPFFPFIFEIKFALQNFRTEKRFDQIAPALNHWIDVSNANNLTLIVEGIETPDDDQLLNDLKVTYRQGYYYGKPRLFE